MPPDGNSASQRRLPPVVRASSGFTLKEVARHNTPDDCWLVVRGKVYDVSQWCGAATLRSVPCGAAAALAGARLTTRAWQGAVAPRRAAHLCGSRQGVHAAVRRVPPAARQARRCPSGCTTTTQRTRPPHTAPGIRSGMLPKYCIGALTLAPGETPPTSYEEDLAEGQFYHTLKKRVDAYFRDNKARSTRLASLGLPDSPPAAARPAHSPSHVCENGLHPPGPGRLLVRRLLRLPGQLRGTPKQCLPLPQTFSAVPRCRPPCFAQHCSAQ